MRSISGDTFDPPHPTLITWYKAHALRMSSSRNLLVSTVSLCLPGRIFWMTVFSNTKHNFSQFGGLRNFLLSILIPQMLHFHTPLRIWLLLYSRGGQLDGLWELNFSRQIRQEPYINKIRYFYRVWWLHISVHPTTISQFQLVMSLHLYYRLKRRSPSASCACKLPELYLLTGNLHESRVAC